jgi:transcriptional regulator with XRE-family HTH domain
MPSPPPDPVTRALGPALRQARRRAGISQGELARRTQLHRTYVGGVERGQRNPSWPNVVRLARGVALCPSELVRDAERLAAAAAPA